MLHLSAKALRYLLWLAVALYVALAAALLGLRYWVLPHVDQWRPAIERQVSAALGIDVSIGAIAADWYGLNPSLHLTQVRLYNPSREAVVLELPRVDATLAWSSVLRLAPRFHSLTVESADLTIRRDARGQLWIAGLPVDVSDSSASAPSPFLAWLTRQRELRVTDATLHWLDEQNQAPELLLLKVSATVRNTLFTHRFALQATPPQALAAGVTLRGDFKPRLFIEHGPDSWNGELYLQWDDAEPVAWLPWLQGLDAREWVQQAYGRMSARAWLRVEQGRVRGAVLDAAVRGQHWQLPGLLLACDALDMHLDADWSLSSDGQPARVEIKQASYANEDMDVSLHGVWQPGEEGGDVNLQGMLARAAMPALARYLPDAVNPDARRWIRQSLLAGELRNAAFSLQGPLAQFPYAQDVHAGQFHVAGRYQGAVVDYAPADAASKGWPALEGLDGSFSLDRAALTLDSPGATARISPDHRVRVANIKAHIPNMEHNAELDVEGEGEGAAADFLALSANTPLGDLLDHALDAAEATGNWRLPMSLHVPLLDTDAAQVHGRVVFDGGDFRLSSAMPWVTAVQGALAFTETDIQSDGMQGTFAGGPVKLSGGLGGKQTLVIAGTLPAAGLGELLGGDAAARWKPLLRRVTGQANYEGKLAYAKKGALDASVRSDLVGLGLDFPAPLGKAAGERKPLSLQWGAATDRGAAGRHWLSGSLGENINLLFERGAADKTSAGAFFSRGAIGVGRAASLPDAGMSLSADLDALNLDVWDQVAKALPEDKKPQKATAAALPLLGQINLSARTLTVAGQTLDQVRLYAQRPVAGQWRVTLDSQQAAGSLEWVQAGDAGAGKLIARLSRFAWGGAEADKSDKQDKSAKQDKPDSSSKPDDDSFDLSDIPAIDLQIKQFAYHGHDLGELDVQGANLERGNLWRLDQLRLSNPAATLDAKGQLQFKGPDRGLSAEGKITFQNVGDMVARFGSQAIKDGSGTLEGKMIWRNLPWQQRLADIDGEFTLSLDKGRFVHLNSRAARLLELLSLQSVSRLATFSSNPASVLQDGFPFDTVRGVMKLSHGVLSTEGYKVNGPAAAIVLEGNADIITEQWNVHALVMPNIDASGAALATAFVNPIVGLGAFVTQWLLKEPLAKAMSVEYQVHGSWDDPQVDEIQPTPVDRSTDHRDGK